MLASLADAPLVDQTLVYEPKYDGIRAIAETAGDGSVRLWSRLGNDKAGQFPEIVTALATWTKRRVHPLVLDGEIVALDGSGRPAGFQQLQGRIHTPDTGSSQPAGGRVALIVFDLLREGATDLRDRPLIERRAALERLLRSVPKALAPVIRLSELARGDGRALYARAVANGWEGLVAKHAASKYKSGARTPDWRKLKIVHEQEFIIGGWTEPRQARVHLGALLLGVYAGQGSTRALVYAGSVGTGFDERELSRLIARLRPLETRDCPFAEAPRPRERPHWAQPTLVAQVKFTEWTADGKLRHPVYLGLRDDKDVSGIQREPAERLHAVARARLETTAGVVTSPSPPRRARGSRRRDGRERSRAATPDAGHEPIAERAVRESLLQQLRELETAGRDGLLELGGGHTLAVTNLRKIFWPVPRLTKGDLFRYYVEVAPFILPAIADRPLVMKRFPNGVEGAPFYQHRIAEVPAGVRVVPVPSVPSPASGSRGARDLQIVGGDLGTLLYTTQLAAISQDPWFSRVQSIGEADYVALDLDPAPDVTFQQVLDVARWIRDELAPLGASSVPKTSGADGLHVYVPLPPGTPYEAGAIFCELVATVVSQKHPTQATIERAVRKRGRRVYVDVLQNILGKTLASAYSARASANAGVSTPLTWEEVDQGVAREEFTIRTVPARLRAIGDLWATLRASKGIDLEKASRHWS